MMGFKESNHKSWAKLPLPLYRVKNFFRIGRPPVSPKSANARFSSKKTRLNVAPATPPVKSFFYLSMGAHRNAAFGHPTVRCHIKWDFQTAAPPLTERCPCWPRWRRPHRAGPRRRSQEDDFKPNRRLDRGCSRLSRRGERGVRQLGGKRRAAILAATGRMPALQPKRCPFRGHLR